MIITRKEFDSIREREENERFSLSVDFGQREVSVIRQGNKAILEDEISLDLEEDLKDKFCYLVDAEGVRKITFFSDHTNKFYKLVPTPDWPTISISSVPMHRLMSPKKDTQNKINFLKPRGYVLDTCMGLGYTAILAAGEAKKVITFEKDENVYTLAQLNPLSRRLFSAENIEIKRANIALEIKELENDCFDCIIHDPPTFKLAGELFSGDFYLQLKRVLKFKGRLFHYTPLYKIKQGFDFPGQVKKRLQKAGFREIRYSSKACGFLCQK